MADISKIKTLDGTEYDLKAYKLKTARTINVGNQAAGTAQSFDGSANITIPVNTLNTQALVRPSGLRGLADNTLQTLVNTTRANRLAFLPADQIIIEKTTDGGTTWVDAGISDAVKVGIFSETRPSISIPLLDGVKSTLCGLRVTITAMKYNVPSGTAETAKYDYWSSTYVSSQERYCQLKDFYFWISANSDTIGIKIERVTGANPTNWSVIFNDTSFYMTGWSGCDYVRVSQHTFGGGTNQTGNFWNYRFTFMTKGVNGTDTMATTSTTSMQSIMEIRGYGDTWWGKSNEYMANDKLYTHDYAKNVTFPAKVTATSFTGDVTGTATTATNVSTQGSATNSTARHIWFSDSSTETKRAHSDNLKYTPSTNTISANISGSAAQVNGHTVETNVPSGAVFTDTTYTANTSKLVTTTVPNVTAAGSVPSLSYTARSVGSASGWSAGTVPTLGTAIAADDITSWTTNTPTSASVSNGILTISTGTAASLGYTARSIPNVTSVGTAPSLTITTVDCDDITSWSAGSAPTIGTAITVATGSVSASGSGATVATGITAS